MRGMNGVFNSRGVKLGQSQFKGSEISQRKVSSKPCLKACLHERIKSYVASTVFDDFALVVIENGDPNEKRCKVEVITSTINQYRMDEVISNYLSNYSSINSFCHSNGLPAVFDERLPPNWSADGMFYQNSYRLPRQTVLSSPVHWPNDNACFLFLFGSDIIVSTFVMQEVFYFANSLISLASRHMRQTEKGIRRPSQRELECLSWVAQGKTSAEISIILNLSEHTINNYLVSVSRKLNAANRIHAVYKAMKLQLIG